jgi:carboxypeptidase family protein
MRTTVGMRLPMNALAFVVIGVLAAPTDATAGGSASYVGSLICERDHVSARPSTHPSTIAVHVMAFDGEPLPDVKVTIRSGSSTEATAMSDSSGRVVFKGLASGVHGVTAELRGFVRVTASLPAVRRGCITAISIPMSVVDVTN